MADWVVLLEATVCSAQPLGAAQVRSLQEALDPGRTGGAVRADDRYALQVTATGAGPVEALLAVVARWSAAARDLGLPPSRLIRTEVCTPEELDRQFEECEREAPRQELRATGPRPSPGDDSDELLRRAFSDPLTGLLAREAFFRQVDVTLTRSDVAAVVCLELDGLRGPDRPLCGPTRDQVMLALARRLAGMLRSGDVLARTGADAFGIVLTAGEEAGMAVARRLAAATRSPIAVPGGEVAVSAHAGVAVGGRCEPGAVVIRNAEAALAAAGPAGAEPLAFGRQMPAQSPPAEAVATPVLQDPLANLQLMQQAAVAANEADTLEEAAQAVARQVGNHVSCDVSQVWVSPAASAADRPSSFWQLVAGRRPATHQVADDFLAGRVAGLAGRVVSTGRPAWLPHIAADDVGSGGLRSGFAFPVTVGGEVAAVMAFFSGAHMEPSGSFEDVVAGIATQLGRLVERQRAAAALRRSAEELRASQALLAAVHQDVTETKRAHEALLGRERRLAEAQRTLGVGWWEQELCTGRLTWSEQMYRLWRWDPEKPVTTAAAIATIHVDDRQSLLEAAAQLRMTGRPLSVDFRAVRGDGELRWFRGNGHVVADRVGAPLRFFGTAQDITEQRAAAEELRTSRLLYRRIVETTREGIVTVDAENRITFVNSRLSRLLGYRVQEMTGMAAPALLGPVFDDVLLPGQPERRRRLGEHHEAHLRAKDGSTVHALLSVSPFVDDDGAYVGALAVVSDITAVRDAEEILRQSAGPSPEAAKVETFRASDPGAGLINI